ncbi:ATP-binding protein [Streptomyces canus]|uniref:ATP-binding protein n=1 Tax=Streptomyces canus TaxID=58343 RepID=UPI0030E4B418
MTGGHVTAGVLVLTVEDNGCDIPPRHRAGVGLRSMGERAAEVGGRLAITPVPGGGTSVQARMPLPQEESHATCLTVREVVQRTETVARTVALRDLDRIPLAPRAAQRLNGQPYTLPEDAVEWIEALASPPAAPDPPLPAV